MDRDGWHASDGPDMDCMDCTVPWMIRVAWMVYGWYCSMEWYGWHGRHPADAMDVVDDADDTDGMKTGWHGLGGYGGVDRTARAWTGTYGGH